MASKPFNLLAAIAASKAQPAEPKLAPPSQTNLKLDASKLAETIARTDASGVIVPDSSQHKSNGADKTISLNVKPAAPPAESSRGFLFGTGITKRIAEQSQRHIMTDATKAVPIKGLFKALERQKELETKAWVDEAKAIEKPVIAEPERIETVDLVKAGLIAPGEKQIELDEYQTAALQGMRVERFCCLIGAAGTGKTTVTKQLARELEQTTSLIDLRRANPKWNGRGGDNPNGPDEMPEPGEVDEPQWNVAIAFMGFTGRSVEQMKIALPVHYHKMCDTMHGHLAFMPEFEDVVQVDGSWKKTVRFYPTFNAARKLPYKVIIIDESSMVPIGLWNQLIDALTPDVRIILIGDINQLPPVMGRSVFGYAMTKWPVFALEKIHRQAEGNPIIANAHKILQGLIPTKVPGKFDMLELPGGSIGAYNSVNAIIMKMHSGGIFDPLVDGLIVPQNKSQLGQTEFNQRLVTYFNAERKIDGIVVNRRHAIISGKTQYALAVGDKVMVTKNDRTKGLTNGMTGVIVEININGNYQEARSPQYDIHNADRDVEVSMEDLEAELESIANVDLSASDDTKDEKDDSQRQASHSCTVKFTNGSTATFATAGAYKTIMHAYAFTCHKAQGSEFPIVVIVVHSANGTMLCREWLYTAVTRARGRVVLLYNNLGLQKALKRQRITGKTVAEKVKAFIAWESEGIKAGHEQGEQLPILWNAEKYKPKQHVEVERGL